MKKMKDGRWKMEGASRPSRSGFTLTEVVLSVAIVAVAAVGMMTAFPTGLKAGRDARDDTVLAMIAEDVFARMRGQPFNRTLVPYVSGRTPAFQAVDLTKRAPVKYVPGAHGTYGWTGVNNAFHYSIDGRPANEISQPSSLGCAPQPDDPYRPDEGYYCLRVFIITNPYANYDNPDPSLLADYANNNLAKVILDFSWPARSPITPTDHRKHKQFVTYLTNLR
ncbi:MAG: prepilin-type N-terminal cleavage/methylation domain-containing protein [Verrucomicrobia bacterium]|nr:prepilin-type N-terminal cleavage/methylation domain-containing protein [Verrucomicrobiota bacterium]